MRVVDGVAAAAWRPGLAARSRGRREGDATDAAPRAQKYGTDAAFSASGLISVLRKTAKPITAAYEK